MGTINVVGAIFSLGGVLLFGKFLSSMPYRPILIWSTIISTLFGLSQLLLVFRVNRDMGIPDGFFCLGESAILSVLGWINTMPILVLAARLCPEVSSHLSPAVQWPSFRGSHQPLLARVDTLDHATAQ
jgi:hypothetical protein